MQQEQTPPTLSPRWRFYERHHPHSLWHGDCLEKVFDQATGRQLYQARNASSSAWNVTRSTTLGAPSSSRMQSFMVLSVSV
jgi:hypothetical protein